MSGRIVCFNGRFVPEHEARLSIFDSALISGDMAFESTRTFQGEPFQLRSHLERLFGTLEILEIKCGYSLEELEALTHETLAKNRPTEPPDTEWQIVHNISPGLVDPYRTAFGQPVQPTVCINCWPLISQLAKMAPLYHTGVPVVIPKQRVIPPTLIDPKAKTRSRIHAKIAQLQGQQIDPAAWPLLLDVEGNLAEGPSWNIFLVIDGCLMTPSTRNVLPGVSRSITIELAGELHIPVLTCDISPQKAQHTAEMFCTATSFCVMPVSTFQGTPLPGPYPGPITRQLMTAWQKRLGVDFIAQAQTAAKRYPAWLESEQRNTAIDNLGAKRKIP